MYFTLCEFLLSLIHFLYVFLFYLFIFYVLYFPRYKVNLKAFNSLTNQQCTLYI